MEDPIKIEEDVLKYWKEKQIMEKARGKNRGKKPFYFLDGPPFVSGDLHPGQMWVKSMKDVLLRYRRFRGYDVYDRAGYDVHGLPIELRAENSLGIKSKKEIETKIGIEKFIQSCKEYVESYIGRMDADYERFGISLDFSNPYLPYKNNYIETEWELFKKMYDKGLVYKQKKVVPYCTRCGTVLSQGSMEVVYHDDPDPSIFVAFKVLKSEKIKFDGELYLLVWTTTPWTLPANIAIAVNPEAKYVIAKFGDRHYVLSSERLDAVTAVLGESATIEAEFYGSELVGTTYEGILQDKVPMQKAYAKYHKVVEAKEVVSTEEGTGLVHIAPGHGLDDYLIGVKNKLPVFSPVDRDGFYTEEAGAYKGLKVPEEANARIIEDLKSSRALVSEGTLTHSYPHCWRCDTKLIYIATDQWFVNIQKAKKRLVAENRKVTWHPPVAQQWQEDLLASSPDWVISRQRYWGVPIPIWESDDGERIVVGSLAELKEYAKDKGAVDKLTDLHRPYIDSIVLVRNGKEFLRIKDVFDVWFDSAIAFRASLTSEQFEKLFPVDFVLEAIEQLRGWFAYQLKVGVLVFNRRPFEHVVMHGMLLGEDGREMHKHLGNYVPLQEILKQTTADSFRLWCVSHKPQESDLVFRMKDIQDANKIVILLYNIENLVKELSALTGYDLSNVKAPKPEDYEDKWILSRLHSAIESVTSSLDNYNIADAAILLRNFLVEDFSRLYLKLAKKDSAIGKVKAKKKLRIINHVLYNLLLLLSPFIPFSTEKVYIDLYNFKESISLEDWPRAKKSLIDKDVEEAFEIGKKAVTALLGARAKAGIKLRQPLEKATIEVKDDRVLEVLERLADIIGELTNIESISVKKVAELGSKKVVPIFSKIGPKFKENAQAVANALKATDADKLESEIAQHGYFELHTEKGAFNIEPGDYSIMQEAVQQDAEQFQYGLVRVDRNISERLKLETLIREIERRIQLSRKKHQLKKVDKILVFYEAEPRLSAIIKENKSRIMADVRAKEIKEGLQADLQHELYNIDGAAIKIQIKKLD